MSKTKTMDISHALKTLVRGSGSVKAPEGWLSARGVAKDVNMSISRTQHLLAEVRASEGMEGLWGEYRDPGGKLIPHYDWEAMKARVPK